MGRERKSRTEDRAPGRRTEHPDKQKWCNRPRRSLGEAEKRTGLRCHRSRERGKGFKKRFATEGARGCSRTAKGPSAGT